MDYNVEQVKVEVDGAEIVKGEGASGHFVTIGAKAAHPRMKPGADGSMSASRTNDSRRPMTISLLIGAVANDVFNDAMIKGGIRLRISRLDDGRVVFEGFALIQGLPRDIGDERVWSLEGVGVGDG